MLRKIKHINKKVFKFQYEIRVHSCQVIHTKKLEPLPLLVSWTRGARMSCTSAAFIQRGVVTWEEEISMLATLYEDATQRYEEKAYKFSLQQDRGKAGKKTLASAVLNLAEYASIEPRSKMKTLALRSVSSQVSEAELTITIKSSFLKEGGPQDDDQLSALSGMTFQTSDGRALESGSEDADAQEEDDFRQEFLDSGGAGSKVATVKRQSQDKRDLEDQLAAMTEEVERSREHVANMEEAIREEQRARAAVEAENKALKQRLTIAAVADAKDPASVRLQAQLSKCQEMLANAERELAVMEDDLIKTEDENVALEKQNATLQAQIKDLSQELQELKLAKATAVRHAASSRSGGQADSYRQDLASAHVQITEYERRIKELEDQIARDAQGLAASKLATQLEAEKQAREELQRQADSMVRDLLSTKMQLAETSFEKDTIYAERRDLAKELAQAKLKYRTLAEKVTNLEVELAKRGKR